MRNLFKLIKKVGLKKGIRLRKEVFHNLNTKLEAIFYNNLDNIDLSKCDKITVEQFSDDLIVVECYRINGYQDRYNIGKLIGVSASYLNGFSKWK